MLSATTTNFIDMHSFGQRLGGSVRLADYVVEIMLNPANIDRSSGASPYQSWDLAFRPNCRSYASAPFTFSMIRLNASN